MISGVVTPDIQAVIRLSVRGPEGREQEVDAAIDTGFDGSLSLPPRFIHSLELPWRGRGRALMADGSESVFDTYEATVMWDGEPRRLSVDEADIDPLVGMALMNGYELRIEVLPGGKVTLERLP
ncbi:MAG: clan AA aspartic protease [Chloroflexi bacterium]|nr:clan AA aspartic protease [Chloroflexota bacterium]